MKLRKKYIFYAYTPLILSLLLSFYFFLRFFSSASEKTGSEKASMLAKTIADSLWLILYGSVLSVIIVVILFVLSSKDNNEDDSQ